MGVAPNANIVAEKVLNSNGSGTSADVASGINKAVAAGASVINLSLTFLPTADIIAAVNNATAKGAFIVWAGGNDAKALLNNANTNGLTANTIKHLLLVGALDTNATQNATFSNRPGSGSLLDTSGGKTSYAARWITAPGVNILAPGIQYGATAMATWSGTSMSAPLISGSLALLQSAWPILKTNGTTANLLLATTTDLGAKGIDAEYGTGRVNLLAAFSPYGPLTTTLASGKTLHADCLLYSGGRQGATDKLGLAAAGLAADERGRIKVNETFQTSAPHVYACGDVIGFPALASTSMEQGRLAACHMFGAPMVLEEEMLPYGIYAIPEISMVGATEDALTERAVPYETGIAYYRETARGQLLGDETGMLKLLIHQQTEAILGVHIIGTSATWLSPATSERESSPLLRTARTSQPWRRA